MSDYNPMAPGDDLRTLRDRTCDAIWCPRCGMFAEGPWPIAIASMHECGGGGE